MKTQAEIVALYGERRGLNMPDLNQSVLSSWETGERRPPLESERFLRLLEILDLYAGEGMLKIETLSRYWKVNLADVPSALMAMQKQVEQTCGQGGEVDIWLVGPTNLPVLHSQGIRDIWAENLARGVNYRIIWFTDKDFAGLTLLHRSLKQIASLIKNRYGAGNGHIYHYGINLLAPMDAAVEQWFADVARDLDFKEITNDVAPEIAPLNLIPPLIEIITPDMAVEQTTSNIATLYEWPKIRRVGHAAPTSLEPVGNEILPSLRLWLMVRRLWMDVWSTGSSASVYNFEDSTGITWEGLLRYDQDDALRQREMSRAMLETYEKAIPRFRSVFMDFVDKTKRQ